MSNPIPQGTRDILPEEMRELRRIEETLRELFEARGYGEVATPAIEYSGVIEAAEGRTGPSHSYRFFDPAGEMLALRSDMTVPIARLAADRLAEAEPPYRLHYLGSAYRAVRPQRGQMREFRQAGVELIGADGPGGTVEIVELLVAALDAVGLTRAVVGLGDADLFRQLLAELGVSDAARDRILDRLAAHDLVAIEAEAGELAGLGTEERALIVELSSLRGGTDVLERAREIGGPAVERASGRLAAVYEALVERGVGDRVQLDFGLLRDLGYYTGAILEVYDPALGHIIGGGGRYDELMGRFGRPMPAAGFALYLERLHIAQAEEERIAREGGRRLMAGPEIARRIGSEGPLTLALPRGALFGGCLDMLDRAGFDTAEPRGASRALIFELEGLTIVTMRPSDVPTYVEAGAADLGITGKDVIDEQADRAVYELADLGFGRCRMVLAAPAGDDSLEQAARRLGTMRIASKYRRIAERYFERTGRQAEVIEVKGSVELAPLVGLAEGIVDLVDTGRTLEENGLEVREEIQVCTARLVANRVAHKLRVDELDAMVERLRSAAPEAP